MRTKENAHDYRYFPDPDLMPVRTETLLTTARAAMPELPAAKRARFVDQYGVSPYDAAVLADDQELSGYFETAAARAAKPKTVANWVLNDLLSAVSTASARASAIARCRPHALDRTGGPHRRRQNQRQAGPGSVRRDVHERQTGGGHRQGKGPGAAQRHRRVRGAVRSGHRGVNPKPVADFKGGNPAPLNFLKGQVMKLVQGSGQPGRDQRDFAAQAGGMNAVPRSVREPGGRA